ncbi:MAG: hypothetical protein CBARDMAM_0048 [uncultured Caballeronia sp.]|nr:MAG: hypothetical protein CBARDMAM_0048 [uncultured Caballeronia sp.]
MRHGQTVRQATLARGSEPCAMLLSSRGHLDATAVAYHLYRTRASNAKTMSVLFYPCFNGNLTHERQASATGHY